MGTDVILLVEDDDELRSMYSAWLSDEYDVLTAENGAKAGALFDETVDIVLLDRHLPDSTSEALLSSFRSARPECRIALVTAIEPDWEILDMDFDAYLTKPIREDELYDAVVALLQRDEQALAKNDGVIL